MSRASRQLPALLLVVLAGLGCGRGDAVVLAASSTREVIDEITGKMPDFEPRVSYGGSASLRQQIDLGAPADLFVSADRQQIDALATRPVAVEKLACNRIVIAVSAESSIERWQDLPRASKIVLGTPAVPIGRYAESFIESSSEQLPAFRGDVLGQVVSRESNTRLVRAKLELGEADAAILYASDLHGSSSLRAVEIPEPWSQTEGVWGALLDPDDGAKNLFERLGATDAFERHGFEPCR